MTSYDGHTAPPKRRRRIFPWVFLAIQLLFIAWIVAGLTVNPTEGNADCVASAGVDACTTAGQVGAGIAIVLMVGLWVAVDFILGVGYLIFRLSRR